MDTASSGLTGKFKLWGGLALLVGWHAAYIMLGTGDVFNAIATSVGFWASLAVWCKVIDRCK